MNCPKCKSNKTELFIHDPYNWITYGVCNECGYIFGDE